MMVFESSIRDTMIIMRCEVLGYELNEQLIFLVMIRDS
jgi:hypothetical protein